MSDKYENALYGKLRKYEMTVANKMSCHEYRSRVKTLDRSLRQMKKRGLVQGDKFLKLSKRVIAAKWCILDRELSGPSHAPWPKPIATTGK